LPCDITTLPIASNLIKAALARAGIHLPPVLQIPAFQYPDLLKIHDLSSLAAFSRSSFYAHKLALPELDERSNQQDLEKLFNHILKGDPDEVKKMLNINPRLALIRRKPCDKKAEVIKNEGGQCIAVRGKTGLMLAEGEEDSEIAALFKAAILDVADEKEARAQHQAQFPKTEAQDWEADEEKRWATVIEKTMAAFKAAAEAYLSLGDIVGGRSSQYNLTVRPQSKIHLALTELIQSCNDILNIPVTTGRHFNPKWAQRVFTTYEDIVKFCKKDANDPRAVCSWQRIVGRMQCLFPANYLQADCNDVPEDITAMLRKKKPQPRLLKVCVRSSTENLIHSQDGWRMSYGLLGVDFAIRNMTPAKCMAGLGYAEDFKAYIIQKQACLQSLHQSPEEEAIDMRQQHGPAR
jgi:hypothetical protein